MKSDLIDLSVQVHHRTAKAILVSIDGNRAAAVWLPLSAVEVEEATGFSFATVTLTEELATAKGLV